jgi:Flp pilus assembly protein TadD
MTRFALLGLSLCASFLIAYVSEVTALSVVSVSSQQAYPEEVLELKTRAQALFEKAKTAEELAEVSVLYRKILKLTPWDNEIYHRLGAALERSGDLALAEYDAVSVRRDICEPDM